MQFEVPAAAGDPQVKVWDFLLKRLKKYFDLF